MYNSLKPVDYLPIHTHKSYNNIHLFGIIEFKLRGMIQKFWSLPCSFVQRHFERQTLHQSKDLVFTYIMMLIFSRYTVSINNYSTLCMVHSIPLAFFHIIELWIYLNLTLSSPASLKLKNKTLLSFYFLLLVLSIQLLEWRQVMSIQNLKPNAEFLWRHLNWQLRHFEYIAEFSFLRMFYFCL